MITISQPTHVDVKTVSQEAVSVSWEEPAETGGSAILKYRLFIAEKDSQGSPYSVDTADNKTSHRLKTPPTMQGKDYVVTVQAINRDQKVSLVSDPAVFSVADPRAKKVEALDKKPPAGKETTFIPVRKSQRLSPITQIDVVDATPGHIALLWQAVTDAQDYKLYWDKGD